MPYKITASFEYSGMVDYWGGNGRRWDNNAGCLFAYYSTDTTLREIVDQWVDEYTMGGDCDEFPEEITEEDIRQAILDSLTPIGLADYNSNELCEWSESYANINGWTAGIPLEEQLPDEDLYLADGESPVAIILIEYEYEPDGDDWSLAHSDDGEFFWVRVGEELGPFASEDEAWDNEPTE